MRLVVCYRLMFARQFASIAEQESGFADWLRSWYPLEG